MLVHRIESKETCCTEKRKRKAYISPIFLKQAKPLSIMDQQLSSSCDIAINCINQKLMSISQYKASPTKIFHSQPSQAEQQVFIVSFYYSFIDLFEGFDKEISTFEEYEPPLVVRQIYKIDETYLI